MFDVGRSSFKTPYPLSIARSIISMWFDSSKKLSVQAFGKLPFYKDYISLVSIPEAIQWRAWMLDIFGQDAGPVPEGRWPFVFQHRPRSNMVVGVIEDSSDGLREFPFSLFVILKGRRLTDARLRPKMADIWRAIGELRRDLGRADTIDMAYSILRRGAVEISAKGDEKGKKGGEKGEAEKPVLLSRQKSWPLLLLASGRDGSLSIAADGATGPVDLLARWRGLQGL